MTDNPFGAAVAVLCLAGWPASGGIDAGPGAEVVEGEGPLLRTLQRRVRHENATVAVRGSTMVVLEARDYDYSCESAGEYGSIGGLKLDGPAIGMGLQAPADEAPSLKGAVWVGLGRGCRSCIYVEMPAELLLKSYVQSHSERAKHWAFMPCPDLLRNLRRIGLQESTIARFAELLELEADGTPKAPELRAGRSLAELNHRRRPAQSPSDGGAAKTGKPPAGTR